jgi:uncharacterized protein involved in outer membrane biogenesis
MRTCGVYRDRGPARSVGGRSCPPRARAWQGPRGVWWAAPVGDVRGTRWRGPIRALVATLLGVVATGVAIALLRPDPERLREELAAQLSAATGRTLAIEGAIAFALHPEPAIEIRDLRLSAPAQPETRLEASSARIVVATLPLLRGEVVLRSARLAAPTLEIPLEAASLAVTGEELELQHQIRPDSLEGRARRAAVRLTRRPGAEELLALDEASFELAWEDGVLELTALAFRIYGGTGSAALRILPAVGQGAAGARELELTLRDVDVAPLLRNLFDYRHASGRGDLSARLAARGATGAELLAALNGTGTLSARDGTLAGAAQVALQAVAGGGRAARFQRVGGSFRVRKGVIESDDLEIVGPTGHARGELRLDLASGGARTVWRRLDPGE